MKFLKEDGTIEEGQPLTYDTVKLRDELQKYLHDVVCKNSYHSSLYDKPAPCERAAMFLALTVDSNQGNLGSYALSVQVENVRLNPVVIEETPAGSVADVAPGFATA